MADVVLEQALTECTEEVLEQMFFIQPVEEAVPQDPPQNGDASHLSVDVDFSGEPSGRLLLRISKPAARSIAADFLAEEEAVLSDQQVGEVICELANIICGSVLTRVESRTSFRLGSPRLLIQVPEPEMRPSAVRSLALWNGNITIAMTMEPELCPGMTKFAS
ncbi:MAG TPA: chemotaxis protein CheX [Bryobacteraceae bacterium]|nr:chemotaxis protein CheX [Bryobacteraceae bacterium]